MLFGTDIHNTLIVLLFAIGYLGIIFEHSLKLNKATTALIMAILCWGVQFHRHDPDGWNMLNLNMHLANVSQVILFLLGALTIVEIIHAHGGFEVMSQLMKTRSKAKALWMIGVASFFLSGVLDNLTTTIVMVMMMRKLIDDAEDRLVFGSIVVIAANAGGAWTPIGDVTTTMLWLGGQLSVVPMVQKLFLPSAVCLAVSLSWFSWMFRGQKFPPLIRQKVAFEPRGKTVFALGILALISVPIFKMITGLPPFMGMLFAMSFMWVTTDIIHGKHSERQHLRVLALLPRIDLSGILFFLGILLAVNSLETAGILEKLAHFLDTVFPSKTIIATLIGLASAVIDNVPLVAACMGMYDIAVYPMDHSFWQLIAFTAGTGGSILVIGSAAGIAFMGIEKVTFFWYLRRISIPAMLGYFAGIITYLVMG